VRRVGAATATTVREASTSNVAVIDSGIDLTHTDLNAVNGKNCIGGGTAKDDNGHGTHVAGTIGAKNNGAGVIGVAPGTKLYAVKVVNSQGSGTDAQVICGIDWVTANAASLGIKVANMSLGGPGADDGNCGNTNADALHRAICNSVAAGVTYVVAAGNSSEDFVADVPANYNEVLTVTAMADFDGIPGGGGTPGCGDGYFEEDDAAAGFSNFTTEGSSDEAHTIAAPGVCIQSTWPGNRYQTISGTSMASPHMAGVVALCFGEKGAAGPCTGLTPAQVIVKMRANASGRAHADPTAGFVGDPDHSVGAYYGYLAWAGATDTVAPVITSVNAGAIQSDAATITWATDENADSQVEYGTTTAYGATTPVSSDFVTSHAVDLSGLTQTTQFHYRVKSRDGWGNLAVSGDFMFTTLLALSDLALSGTVSPEPAATGDTLTYQLTLTNKGPARASGSTLQVTLPTGLTLGTATPSQGSCTPSGQTVSCAFGTLEVGGPTTQMVADHPAGFWRLGDPAGSSTAADASGHGINGAVDTGVTLAQPGAITGDTAATFPGTGPAITVPQSTLLELVSAVSVEAWVRPTLAGQNGGIFEKTVGGRVNSQYMLFLEGGVAKFRVRTASGALLPVDGPALPLNTWSHLVGTFDGTTLRLYLNGVLVSSVAAQGPLASGSGPSFVGRLGQSLYPFKGSLDEVAVFPGALSPARVRAHYLGGAVNLGLTATAAAAGTLRATAAASANETDPDSSNNTLNLDSTIVTSRADLALSGAVSPASGITGDTLTYQLTLTNNGPARASGAAVSLTLPAGLTFGTATPSQGTCTTSGQVVSCAVGTLEVGAPTPAQIGADHPSGFWRLGDPAGSTSAADASGNGLTGAVDSGVTLGQPGATIGDTAATFPGTGPAVTVAQSALLDLSSAVSVEAWVRPIIAGQNGGIFEKTINGAVNSQYMLFLEAGVAKFRVRTASGALLPVDGPTLPLNTWSHLVGTFDGSVLRLYVNGAQVASATAVGPLTSGSGPSFIGRLGQSVYPFRGSLDEVAVFAGTLSADRVRAHYLGGVATLRVTATATAAGALRTTATAQANESDPNLSNNTLNLDSTIATARADLALSGTVGPEPAVIGDTLTYQLTLTNNGPARGTGGTLQVTLPTGLTPGAATPSQGSCTTTGQSVSCAVGTLEAGGPAQQVLTDHPAGFWRLGDPAGSTSVADTSGDGLTGAVDPGVTLGQPGAMSGDTAATFPGTGPAVTIAQSPFLDLSSAVSVEAWVRPTAAGQNGGIFEKTINGSVNSQYMLFLEAGIAKFRIRTATGALLPVNGPTLPLSTWSHLVGTFDGATLRLYVNGTLAASAAAQGPLASGSGVAFLGRLGQNLYPFKGSIDEVAVFTGALSADGVRAHYLGGMVTVRVTATASAGGTLRATASASANETDSDPSNNTLTLDSTIAVPRADLVLTGSVSPQLANVGDTLTYQLALNNNGPARASAGALSVTLPAGLAVGTATPSQGSCSTSGQVVSCAVGTLEASGPTTQILADHPAGFWRLGDPVGSATAADASGNGLTGAVDAGVSLGQPGAVGGDTAASFIGSGAAVAVGASPLLELTSAVSVEAWVRPTAAAQNGGIFEKTVNGVVNSQYMLFLESGVAKFRIRTATGALLPVNGPTLPLNTWSHLVGTFDGTTLRLYVNGVLAASAAAQGPIVSGSGAAFIGRLAQNLYPFQGTIDEVVVFSGALSPERVRAHYLGGAATLKLTATATASGTLRATATAQANETDPDPSSNTLNLDSTIR
jgi:uncharacterized repeat protein (TIGR01451 family)